MANKLPTNTAQKIQDLENQLKDLQAQIDTEKRQKAYSKVNAYLMLQTPPNNSKNPFASLFLLHLFLNADDKLKELSYQKAAQDAVKFKKTIPPTIENQTIESSLNLGEV